MIKIELPVEWSDILELSKHDPTVAAVLNAFHGASRESLLCHMVWFLVEKYHFALAELLEQKMTESKPIIFIKEDSKDA